MKSELKEHPKRGLGSIMSQNTDSLWDGAGRAKQMHLTNRKSLNALRILVLILGTIQIRTNFVLRLMPFG